MKKLVKILLSSNVINHRKNHIEQYDAACDNAEACGVL